MSLLNIDLERHLDKNPSEKRSETKRVVTNSDFRGVPVQYIVNSLKEENKNVSQDTFEFSFMLFDVTRVGEGVDNWLGVECHVFTCSFLPRAPEKLNVKTVKTEATSPTEGPERTN